LNSKKIPFSFRVREPPSASGSGWLTDWNFGENLEQQQQQQQHFF
jgi:hypothetical protein